MNNIVSELIKEYDLNKISEIKYPFAEIMQKIILCCLSKIGFFKEVVFHGGTCLRIIHGLNRFSEDLDFSLKNSNKPFSLKDYIAPLLEQLQSFGLKFTASKIKESTSVNKCILSTKLYELVKEHCEYKYLQAIRDNELLKIKIEVDTNPPLINLSDIEETILYQPLFSIISIFKMPTLFAGKINAIITRPFTNIKEKGRDYYDYLFYMSKHIKPNLNFLKYSLNQFDIWDSNKELKLSDLQSLLLANFKIVNIEDLKNDVYPLIKNQNELDVWTNDMFVTTLKDLKKE